MKSVVTIGSIAVLALGGAVAWLLTPDRAHSLPFQSSFEPAVSGSPEANIDFGPPPHVEELATTHIGAERDEAAGARSPIALPLCPLPPPARQELGLSQRQPRAAKRELRSSFAKVDETAFLADVLPADRDLARIEAITPHSPRSTLLRSRGAASTPRDDHEAAAPDRDARPAQVEPLEISRPVIKPYPPMPELGPGEEIHPQDMLFTPEEQLYRARHGWNALSERLRQQAIAAAEAQP